jgi:hypothetical protein
MKCNPPRKLIRLQVGNGLDFDEFVSDVLQINHVTDHFDIVESQTPDVIVFGPYGQDIPNRGPYLRVAYLCENYRPLLQNCDFCFGAQDAPWLDSRRYFRIHWHGLNPQALIKPAGRDIEALAAEKSHLCNFIYSNRVPYREKLYDRLSRHIFIHSPGGSRNNCSVSSLSARHSSLSWSTKRDYLRHFKYTLALESYWSPGYRTEKLTDPMLADSIPIYVGDQLASQTFNPKSFLEIRPAPLNNVLGTCLRNFGEVRSSEILGPIAASYSTKAVRKMRARLRVLRTERHVNNLADQILESIFRLERDKVAYLEMLAQPWFRENRIPSETSNLRDWQWIFAHLP